MILVAGGIADSVTELVCARLAECEIPYRLLDLGRYPEGHGMDLFWRQGTWAGRLQGPSWTLDLEEISGAFVRFLGAEARVQPQGLPDAQAHQVQHEADAALALLMDHLACPVMNRSGGGMSNNSKPHQLQLIGSAGLLVPPTMVTNDPDAVRAFRDEHGALIYKSISGIRSVVRRLEEAQMARLDLLRHGPAQFQAFVPGCNVRVHTVGEQLFATRILTEAVDYRYARRDGLEVQMEPAELPPAVATACLRIAADLGLLHAGIDLKETPDGVWYCFEVNPCPGFIYYERHTGQAISLAIAEHLRDGRPELPFSRGSGQSPGPDPACTTFTAA